MSAACGGPKITWIRVHFGFFLHKLHGQGKLIILPIIIKSLSNL